VLLVLVVAVLCVVLVSDCVAVVLLVSAGGVVVVVVFCSVVTGFAGVVCATAVVASRPAASARMSFMWLSPLAFCSQRQSARTRLAFQRPFSRKEPRKWSTL
jgi:hypothetical protein